MPTKYQMVYMVEGRPERSLVGPLRDPGPRKFVTGCTRCGRMISFPIQDISETIMAASMEGRTMITSCPRCLKVAEEQFDTRKQIWEF